MKALASHSRATVVSLGVARVDDGVRRQLHQRAHDRVAQVGVGGVPGRSDAADRVLEQRVAGEHRQPGAGEPAGRALPAGARRRRPRRPAALAHEEREHPGGVPGRVQRAHLERAEAQRLRRPRSSPSSGVGSRAVARRRPSSSSRSRRLISTSSSGQRSRSSPTSLTWSKWWWVSSTWVGVSPRRSAASISGSTGPPASMKNAGPPSPSATR